MRSRRLALPPRCGSMLSSRCLLRYSRSSKEVRYSPVLLRYTYTLLNRTSLELDNRTRSVDLKEDLIL